MCVRVLRDRDGAEVKSLRERSVEWGECESSKQLTPWSLRRAANSARGTW